ncbi:MAG: VCBS repeat-containing protein [Planctomycetes bacterium]|nr:VCBS repeat-containing protein [Planctomycetota bacterium]
MKRHESPQFVDPNTGKPIAPNFAAVAFGDVTGDGAEDLYFANYSQSLEDRLLVNDGKGFFTDETVRRLPSEFVESSLGYACAIVDMNADGFNDIVKNTHHGPMDLAIAYNDPSNEGFFRVIDLVYNCCPSYVSVGDLNNDGKLDLVAPADAQDHYFLNQGNGPDGLPDWISFPFPESSNGFDHNTVIADLDNDGFNDVLIADVDLDLPSCAQRLDIHHNLGLRPNLSFQEDVGNLPTDARGPLRGTHDVAVFDLNGDGRLDLVIGTCSGTTIWIQQLIGDLDGDGTVGILDLLILLSNWGPCPDPPEGCPADLDDDGSVGILDLLTLLANWG